MNKTRRTALKSTRSSSANTTAERAINILLLFSEQKPVLTAQDVSQAFGVPRSTTYRYLKSLASTGLLAPSDNGDGGYRVGPRILELARISRVGMATSPAEIALPVMKELVASTGETALLARLSGQHVVCIERIDSPNPVRISYERGQLLPLHAGASAKALLAFLPEQRLSEALDEIPRSGTGRRTIDPAALRKQLRTIQQDGYAVTEGEVDRGVVGVAAPVFSSAGRAAGAAASLALVMPSFRAEGRTLTKLARQVTDAAEKITQRIIELGV